VFAVPTSSWHGGAAMAALGRGVLRGSAAEGGCVWLELPNRDSLPVVWPAGSHARFGPIRIYDGSGRVVATEGQLIEVGGGVLPVRDTRCALGRSEVFNIQSDIQVIDG
jgi:hypothetical protein